MERKNRSKSLNNFSFSYDRNQNYENYHCYVNCRSPKKYTTSQTVQKYHGIYSYRQMNEDRMGINRSYFVAKILLLSKYDGSWNLCVSILLDSIDILSLRAAAEEISCQLAWGPPSYFLEASYSSAFLFLNK